jgi:exopolyphosphatase/guanosine-5'-triphosphate,3'-diphosphate pyrophosphatase
MTEEARALARLDTEPGGRRRRRRARGRRKSSPVAVAVVRVEPVAPVPVPVPVPAPAIQPAQATGPYAALDLGTNNCRLLIARPTEDGFRVVDAFSRIVRLGEGLGAGNRLGGAAMDRAVEALHVCRDKIDSRGASRVRLIATEACRAAENGADFLARVQDEVGLTLEIVDRGTEAGLAARGCVPLMDPLSEGALLFDIGGGSSEIVWLERRRGRPAPGPPQADIRAWTSLPVGVVTLSERHGGVHVTLGIFDAMVDEVSEMVSAFAAGPALRAAMPRLHMLGTSGTVTTLAGLHLGLRRYERRLVDGLWMDDDTIGRVMGDLVAMPWESRVANPCIGAERADLVLAGCAIFEAIRRAFPCRRMRVADRGLREGMLIDLMAADGAWIRPWRVR